MADTGEPTEAIGGTDRGPGGGLQGRSGIRDCCRGGGRVGGCGNGSELGCGAGLYEGVKD